MPKAPSPSRILPFQGVKGWPTVQEGLDDWGLSPEQQESYVEQFRRILEAKGKYNPQEHDYFTMRRFLRARNYDLEKATTMFLAHLDWEQEFQVHTILTNFVFKERTAFVEAYPQGYHKVDKVGRPVYVQQLGKIDVAKLKKICSEQDMLKFHIQEYERCRKIILPICSRLAGRQIDQTFGIMDVSGVGLGHLTGEVKRLMSLVTKYDQDNYPEMLGHICIINAPYIFKTLWGMVKGFVDPRTQSKIEILGTNYKEALLKWVDEENLMVWMGGKSQGSLLDDIGPWSDAELLKRVGVNVEELRSGKALPGLPAQPSLSRQVSLTAVASPGFRRSGSNNSATGFLSAPGSEDHGNKRMPSGISQLAADEAAQRYAASQSNNTTAAHASPSKGHSGSPPGIAEVQPNGIGQTFSPLAEENPPPPHQTLRVRIAALEKSVAPYTDRKKQDGYGMDMNGSSNGVSVPTAGPDASLLQRVEVLEEALSALLEAQAAMLQKQKQELSPGPPPPQARKHACCTIQ